MGNKPFISGAATSGDLKATTMRKSSSLSRIDSEKNAKIT